MERPKERSITSGYGVVFLLPDRRDRYPGTKSDLSYRKTCMQIQGENDAFNSNAGWWLLLVHRSGF